MDKLKYYLYLYNGKTYKSHCATLVYKNNITLIIDVEVNILTVNTLYIGTYT